ncbi:hypothetical protein ETAA8_28250 [Anatilimnocola aggregata]|uniref:Uncharacterized protein n=1 Tax=Anatilimnocola aggregata TaxID=2528021 RepID=A0A517YBW9_9BACT|nr:hypothetical protein [Anatilimnocola aggregata]QDU27735.1 hypothetical protein ETAA8_28250 [Anatilimnocola aggregata]
MTDHELLGLINTAKKDFGHKCSKYAGAVCAELLKHSLSRHGVTASARDVFIDGIPIEVDLLIAREGVEPKHGLLYRPEDVRVVLEIKNSGVFELSAISRIRHNFDAVRDKNPKITCVYVTLAELKGYKYAVTTEALGYPAYTLFLYNSSQKNRKYEVTGHWDNLIHDLQQMAGCVPCG